MNMITAGHNNKKKPAEITKEINKKKEEEPEEEEDQEEEQEDEQEEEKDALVPAAVPEAESESESEAEPEREPNDAETEEACVANDASAPPPPPPPPPSLPPSAPEEEKKSAPVTPPKPESKKSKGHKVVNGGVKRCYAPKRRRGTEFFDNKKWLSGHRCGDLLKRAGCGSQNHETIDLLRLVVNHVTKDLTAKAVILANHNGRKTVDIKDMEYAGKLQTGKPTYAVKIISNRAQKASDHDLHVSGK